MKKPRKRCELCKHWEPWEFDGRKDGACRLFEGDGTAPDNGLCVCDAQGCIGSINTGYLFGCVRFARKSKTKS